MANVLKMAQIQTIEALWRRGWSCRRIARELGIHRDTVRGYVKRLQEADSKPAKVTAGKSADLRQISGVSPPEISKPATQVTAGSRSKCGPLRKEILEKLKLDLSAQRIYQDLVTEEEFAGSYESVKRYVRKLEAAQPLPFRRMECRAGEECQVDFGQGAWIQDHTGKRKRPWLFRIVLSHSRSGYSEPVWKQTTEAFIRAIENAFWFWGGVPETVVVDNLRAAVKRADWFDPELNPKIEEFARHYGVAILPTKSYTPRHKGKIERGVDYAQDNALKGRTFPTLTAQKEFLHEWEKNVADQRIHGTIRKQVRKQFEEVERPALKPLPAERFPLFQEGQRKVHRDGHVEIDRAYYSVPPEYLGHTVWARYDSRIIRIFTERMELIATHAKAETGLFSTDRNHLASEKISRVEKGADWLVAQAARIGPQTGLWARTVMEERGIAGMRVINGLLSIAKKSTPSRMEVACGQALSHGSYRLKTLRKLLTEPVKQENFEFMDEHPLIRQMSEYTEFVNVTLRKEEV